MRTASSYVHRCTAEDASVALQITIEQVYFSDAVSAAVSKEILFKREFCDLFLCSRLLFSLLSMLYPVAI